MTSSESRHDSFAALRVPDYRLLLIGRLIAQITERMVGVAVGWEIYERTGDPFMLGILGLVQVIPVFLFSLPGGYVADRRDRKRIVIISQFGLLLCSLTLTILSSTQAPIFFTFIIIALFGLARAFNNPAEGALTPLIVPDHLFGNAATWSSTVWQFSAVIGPAIGGLLIAQTGGAAAVYASNVIGGIVLIVTLFFIHPRKQIIEDSDESPIQSVRAGMRFLRDNRLILASITLDMFAVLLGGATYLLPVFAKDILHVDASGYGLLAAAPSVGAFLMAIIVAARPPFRNAGRTLLLAVAGFGVATIIFGISTNFYLSLAMMATLGALDNISVIIRHTLEMIFTPDNMRGRVGAVQTIFISASNELGGFESGIAAALLGPIGAVVFGGLGTLAVVAAVAYFSPELRRLKRIRLEETVPAPSRVPETA